MLTSGEIEVLVLFMEIIAKSRKIAKIYVKFNDKLLIKFNNNDECELVNFTKKRRERNDMQKRSMMQNCQIFIMMIIN